MQKYTLILILLIVGFVGVAQPKPTHPGLFLFTDRDYCISGDTVWFKVEIRNGFENESNVVHVQLDAGGDRFIAEVKKKSNDNWAEGYIHIPDSLSTGVYFLTSFLNKQRSQSFFNLVKKSLFVYNRFDERVTKLQVPNQNNKLKAADYKNKIPVRTNKLVFSPRERVTAEIDLSTIDTSNVRRVVIRASHIEETARQNGGRFLAQAISSKPSIPVMDEKDGFLLSGIVTNQATGLPAKNVVVLLSLFGEQPYLDYYYTDSTGNFHFFLKNAYGSANAVLQAVSNNNVEFDLQIDKNYLVTEAIEANRQILTPEQSDGIEDAIDGVFFKKLFAGTYSVADERFFMPARFEVPFYGPPFKRIFPSDFFYLSDFREITRELLPGIQYRVRDGRITLRLLNDLQNIWFRSDPLRMINGIPVFKNQILAEFNSNSIEYIDYVLEERLYGDLNFKGVLSVSLKDKSNSWMTQQPNFFRETLPCLQFDKQPEYITIPVREVNVPDIRQVNYWQVAKTGSQRKIEFYLSDLKGKVEISVEGVSGDKSIFKSSKIIEVK